MPPQKKKVKKTEIPRFYVDQREKLDTDGIYYRVKRGDEYFLSFCQETIQN